MNKGLILGLMTPQSAKKIRANSSRQINTQRQIQILREPNAAFLSQKKKKLAIFNKNNFSNFETPHRQISKRQNQQSIVTYFNTQSPTKKEPDFTKQKLNMLSVAISDFCGCQKYLNPCQIINENFIKYASMKQMEQQYEKIDMPMSQCPISYQTNKNVYLGYLPSWYPQIYYSSLGNIMKNIFIQINQKKNVMQFGRDEFIFLAWIQYHSKIEYLTYFLYRDTKKQFNNYQSFVDKLDISLIAFGSSIEKQNEKLPQLNFKHFLKSYYKSLGAIFIPTSHYAQFFSILMMKGGKILINLLSYFLNENFQQFKSVLYSLNYDQFEDFRKGASKCQWQQILSMIQDKKD